MAKQSFRFRGESQVLDAEARSSAPGRFVDLPDGVVHYEMGGPLNAQTVVLVHGFSVPYYIWDPTFEALVEEDPVSPVVLRSAHPSVFLAGAHLAEIAALDAASCKPYADRGRRVVEHIENHPAPAVAAVNGSCSGGGFDLVLACDTIVAGAGASFQHSAARSAPSFSGARAGEGFRLYL